jgi:hypothetical protein
VAGVLRHDDVLQLSLAIVLLPIIDTVCSYEEHLQVLPATQYFDTSCIMPCHAGLQVGWWDPDVKAWSTEGVSDVILDPSSSSLSFHTTHLGPLAVIQSRARLLPYAFWCVLPYKVPNLLLPCTAVALVICCAALCN